MSWIQRVLGRAQPASGDAEVRCSFCRKSRIEVRRLVSGPRVAICDECIGLSAQVIDDDASSRGEVSAFAELALAAVIGMGPRAPYARARPLLRGAIEIGRRHRLFLHRVATAAVELDDLDSAVAALRAIPSADWVAADGVDLGGLLGDLGHHAEAIEVLTAVDGAALDGAWSVFHALHVAKAQLERGDLDATAIALVRGRIAELAEAAAALPAEDCGDPVRARRLMVMTLAALAAGALDAAEHGVRAHLALRPDVMAHVHLARVMIARGDQPAAEAARAAGLACAHPEGVYADRLRAATAGPFR